MSVPWRDALSPEELKERLPLEYVCVELGIALEPAGDRLLGLCPFHEDVNPSFAIYDEGKHWGCWPCQERGDHFDLVRAKLNLGSFAEVYNWLVACLDRMPEDWQPLPLFVAAIDVTELRAAVEEAQRDGALTVAHVSRMLVAKGMEVDPNWLVQEFRLGTIGTSGEVLIPHYDAAGTLHGYKYRLAGSKPKAARGSDLSQLYGIWRDRGQRHAVVCEGESDTWTAAWALRDREVLVVGLPAGAHPPRTEWVAALEGRAVILALDADPAGRRATAAWLAVLGEDVRLARIPEGKDLGELGPERARRVLLRARAAVRDVSQLVLVDQCYGRPGRNVVAPVANFALVPIAEYEFEDQQGVAYDVRFAHDPAWETSIRSDDLATEGRATSWSNARGLSWYGTRRDAQDVLGRLRVTGQLLPHGRATTIAGYHDGGFVLPSAVLADETWQWFPPGFDPGLMNMCHVRPGPFEWRGVGALLALHLPEVVWPILAWCAAAPLRALCDAFPPLAVMGSSGSGKTTLVGEVLRTFAGSEVFATLTSTTPHAVHSLAACTNGLPVWFDEYRPGARFDARLAVEQVLRDAWTGQASLKGGLRDNLQALTSLPARAPLVISGEDAFTETSHAERLVQVHLPLEGRSVQALRALKGAETTGLAHAYLTHLHDLMLRGELPRPPRKDEAEDRPAHGRAVLRWGWGLLRSFISQFELPELPLAEVQRTAQEAVPPIMDALSWALGRNYRDAMPLAYQDGEDVCLRLRTFMTAVREDGNVILPGGERAVLAWLEERFECVKERDLVYGRLLRLKGAFTAVSAVV